MSLSSIFGSEHSLTAGQECARAVLIFVYGLILVRIAGRRVFGKWAALDIVVSVIVGSSLSRALTGAAPLWGTLLAAAALVLVHWLFAQAIARSRTLSLIVEGRGIDLAEDGLLDDRSCHTHSVSRADIDEALRGSGVTRIESTSRVTLEPSGRITVLKAD